MSSRVAWMLLATAVLASPGAGGSDSGPPLRISLQDRAADVRLGPGEYELSQGRRSRRLRLKAEVRVVPTPRGLRAGKEDWSRTVVVASDRETSGVRLNGRFYRGRIELESRGSSLRVINVLPTEAYLRGVLHMETSAGWPEEALKAQAVISRTYALRNRGRHGARGADLCATPHCQAYGGVAAERTATDAAVRRTTGEVLVDRKGRLVNAVYHSACGGSTESAENVWRLAAQPYLKRVRCTFCSSSPHFTWVARVSTSEVTRAINRAGHDVGEVRAIGILSHSPSGRVHRLRIFGQRGTRDIPANTFRNLVDPGVIRSTYWSGISKLEKRWQIHGRGWGHGVGLCQWGMRAHAENGMAYGGILRYYYRRVEVADWKE